MYGGLSICASLCRLTLNSAPEIGSLKISPSNYGQTVADGAKLYELLYLVRFCCLYLNVFCCSAVVFGVVMMALTFVAAELGGVLEVILYIIICSFIREHAKRCTL